jgi:NAD(P)-dependent dehydrogenase (short-subunit alcohol dehydrogenase family)
MTVNPDGAGGWLITGCSTGIGRHIAEAALAKGHRVAVTARNRAAVEDIVAAHRATRSTPRCARPSAPSAASTCS